MFIPGITVYGSPNCLLERKIHVGSGPTSRTDTIQIQATILGIKPEDKGSTCLFSGNEFTIVAVYIRDEQPEGGTVNGD